jgi:N-acyl homoserine lactone hydrolase
VKANVTWTSLVAVLALATVIPNMRIFAASNPQVKSGADRLYVIDCGERVGHQEPTSAPHRFSRRCYLIRHTQGFLWDTGIDVAQLPNQERLFHEWGPAPARFGANQ